MCGGLNIHLMEQIIEMKHKQRTISVFYLRILQAKRRIFPQFNWKSTFYQTGYRAAGGGFMFECSTSHSCFIFAVNYSVNKQGNNRSLPSASMHTKMSNNSCDLYPCHLNSRQNSRFNSLLVKDKLFAVHQHDRSREAKYLWTKHEQKNISLFSHAPAIFVCFCSDFPHSKAFFADQLRAF